MPRFSYLAMGRDGQETAGVLEGPDAAWVNDRLSGDDLLPIEVEKIESAVDAFAVLHSHIPVNAQDISLFCTQFAIMIDAGMPLLAALELLAENAPKRRLAEAIGATVEVIRDGGTLHDGLARTKLFSSIFLSMIEAAESGGTMVEVLKELARQLDREARLQGRLKSAMTYPAFLGLLSIAVVIFLMTFIVPRFTLVLDNLGVELPWPTRVLMAMSSFIAGYWPWMLGALALAGAGLFVLSRRETVRARWDTWHLSVPVLGDLTRKTSLSRLCYVLGGLLEAGVPLVAAMEVTANTAGNRRIGAAIRQAREDVTVGSSVSAALGSSGVLPKLLVQMVAIGEATGNLDQVLRRIAEIYDEQIERAIQSMIGLVEPVLIVVMGGVVGFIAMALVLPMVRAVSSIGG